jgi:hypothetical protein
MATEESNIAAFHLKKRRGERMVKMSEPSHGKGNKNNPTNHELSACSFFLFY